MITRSARLVPGTLLSSSFTTVVVLCSVILSSLLCLVSAQSNNCGASLTPIVTGWGLITQGQYPWLAVLYRLDEAEKWTHFCAGALVSNRFVLTAAHCLVSGGETVKTEHIKVGLGKIHTDYYNNEDHATIANVSEVFVPENFIGSLSNYALDVGLLKLSTAVQTSDYILPACIDLDKTTRVSNGAMVHAASWGSSSNGTSNNRASADDSTYLDYRGCLNEVLPLHRRYITHDKICSLSINGSHLIERGDAGGALTFLKDGRHFIVGVLSTKIRDLTVLTINTDPSAPEIKSWLKERLGSSH